MNIYLDNNATTKIDKDILDAMLPFLKEDYGNPSSLYGMGSKVKRAIDLARASVAKLMHASTSEIIFTSSASESNVTAIMSAIASDEKKKHIITTSIEHASIMETMKYLSTKGYNITYLSVDEYGRLDLKELENAIRDDTILIAVMMANNEIGNLYDVNSIGAIAKKNNILYHVDAVQAVGKVNIDVAKIKCDTLSISAHKIHGPKGIGVLYKREGIPFKPLIFGHQEDNRRGGTENAAYIVGLGVAADKIMANMEENNKLLLRLREKLENDIISSIEDTLVYGDKTSRLPNTLSIAFKGVDANELMFMLEGFNIYVSTGSACNAKEAEPSHVLTSMHANLKDYSPIRISLSEYTTEEEIVEFVKKVTNVVTMLRKKNLRKED